VTVHDSSCRLPPRLSDRCRCRRPSLDDDRPGEMSTAGDAPTASAALGGTPTRGRIVRCERSRWGRGARAHIVVRSCTLSFATRRVVRDANASTRTRVDGRARESDVRANRTRARIGRERGEGGTSSRSRGRRRCRWRRRERDEIDELMMTFYFLSQARRTVSSARAKELSSQDERDPEMLHAV